MSATMAKQKRTRSKPVQRTEPREAFHLPADLREALVKFVDDARPETSKTAVIKLALEEFLTKHGYWPPERK